ncbi:MAG: shikimate dehydrogenase [Selenomonadaceae bacterium]|nr:shikimate dehydrogenase [Selenomonadaceae bacterium]
MIKVSTKNLGIIGYPIGHTLSPVMQTAAIKSADLDYSYIAIPVQKGKLVLAVDGLRDLDFRGWNVTIPLKSAIAPLLDSLDADAKMIGAVNTVVNDGGRLTGYNTDVTGFLKSLNAIEFLPEECNAVVLGAGGAARAVIWGLCKRKAAHISIGVRNPEKYKALVDDFEVFDDIEIFHWETEEFKDQMQQADILINTTPLGMMPDVDTMPPVDISLLPEGALVYDTIYTPAKTKFLAKAEELGYPISNGMMMLLYQGVEAFRLFTGVEPDEEVMLKALKDALKDD